MESSNLGDLARLEIQSLYSFAVLRALSEPVRRVSFVGVAAVVRQAPSLSPHIQRELVSALRSDLMIRSLQPHVPGRAKQPVAFPRPVVDVVHRPLVAPVFAQDISQLTTVLKFSAPFLLKFLSLSGPVAWALSRIGTTALVKLYRKYPLRTPQGLAIRTVLVVALVAGIGGSILSATDAAKKANEITEYLTHVQTQLGVATFKGLGDLVSVGGISLARVSSLLGSLIETSIYWTGQSIRELSQTVGSALSHLFATDAPGVSEITIAGDALRLMGRIAEKGLQGIERVELFAAARGFLNLSEYYNQTASFLISVLGTTVGADLLSGMKQAMVNATQTAWNGIRSFFTGRMNPPPLPAQELILSVQTLHAKMQKSKPSLWQKSKKFMLETALIAGGLSLGATYGAPVLQHLSQIFAQDRKKIPKKKQRKRKEKN